MVEYIYFATIFLFDVTNDDEFNLDSIKEKPWLKKKSLTSLQYLLSSLSIVLKHSTHSLFHSSIKESLGANSIVHLR